MDEIRVCHIENKRDFSCQIQYRRLSWYLVDLLWIMSSCKSMHVEKRKLWQAVLVKKTEFDEKQVEKDRDNNWVRCVPYFVGPPSPLPSPPTFLAFGYSKSFRQPWIHNKLLEQEKKQTISYHFFRRLGFSLTVSNNNLLSNYFIWPLNSLTMSTCWQTGIQFRKIICHILCDKSSTRTIFSTW